MLATLPMYDWPEVWAENDALWVRMRDALREEGLKAPDELDRSVGYKDSWTRPDLVLGQACGLPYIEALSDKVVAIGAVDLGLPECGPGQYYSHIIVPNGSNLSLDDLKTRPFAYNTPCSQSGLAALQKMGLAKGRGIATGGHRASIQMIAEGQADYAAIDAASWELAVRHEPAQKGVSILAQTKPTPAPVYIAALGADLPAYRRALPELIPVRPDDYLRLL